MSQLRKKRLQDDSGQSVVTPENADETFEADNSKTSSGTKRVRMCCDITRELYRKLRMEAARSDRTNLEVIESLIANNIN